TLTLYVTGPLVPEPELPPPQAFSRSRKTQSPASNSQRRRLFPSPTPANKIPDSGTNAKKSCGRIPFGLSFCFSRDAELEGTVMVSENGTAWAPGVTVVIGEPDEEKKPQVALGGNELCKQESVIGCPGAPVFAFNDREYVAVPPGDVV